MGSWLVVLGGGLLVALGVGGIVWVLVCAAGRATPTTTRRRPACDRPSRSAAHPPVGTATRAPGWCRARATRLADAPTMLHSRAPVDEFPDPYGAPMPAPQPPTYGGAQPGWADAGYGAADPAVRRLSRQPQYGGEWLRRQRLRTAVRRARPTAASSRSSGYGDYDEPTGRVRAGRAAVAATASSSSSPTSRPTIAAGTSSSSSRSSSRGTAATTSRTARLPAGRLSAAGRRRLRAGRVRRPRRPATRAQGRIRPSRAATTGCPSSAATSRAAMRRTATSSSRAVTTRTTRRRSRVAVGPRHGTPQAGGRGDRRPLDWLDD